jgi:hypothetical protein
MRWRPKIASSWAGAARHRIRRDPREPARYNDTTDVDRFVNALRRRL